MNTSTSVMPGKDNKRYILTWITDVNVDNYTPVTQVYGVVFNEKDEILICRPNTLAKWQIPGGTPEADETFEETLRRELVEEVNVTVSTVIPVGVQKIEEENILTGEKKLICYQLRYAALLKELLPREADPDFEVGVMWETKFVPSSDVTKYVQWGDAGDAMFRDAILTYETLISLSLDN